LALVREDEAKVALALCRHLMLGGFRRVAFCSVPTPGRADFRAEALDAVARAEGLAFDGPDPRLRMSAVPGVLDGPALARWVRRLPKPVGVIAWNMTIARHALTACLRAGVSVPADAAIVSWDDDPPLAASREPTITLPMLP